MEQSVVLVKNMVCNRCVMAVENILKDLAIPFQKIGLGEIHLNKPLTIQQKKDLAQALEQIGFQLIDDRITSLIEKIKQLTISKARNTDETANKLKLSAYLSAALHHDYSYLSNLFSSIEGRTIENYFIEQRIEYVKELLVYDEMSLSEIALQLEYSSTAHLSAQFKKVTGLTPSYYKQLGAKKRKGLDTI